MQYPQKHYWEQRDGTRILLNDMEESHIKSILTMYERNVDKYKGRITHRTVDINHLTTVTYMDEREFLLRYTQYGEIEDELKRRSYR